MQKTLSLVFGLLATACGAAHAQTLYGIGLSTLAQSQPHPSGYAFVATCVSTEQQVWWFSEIDYLPALVNHRLVYSSSPRTGIAQFIRAYGRSGLYALGDAGISSNTSVNLAGALGAVLVTPLKNRYYWTTGFRVVKTAQTQNANTVQVEMGIAWE